MRALRRDSSSLGVGFGEFVAATGIDGGFETGDALQAPLRVGHGLDEFGFAQADRFVFLLVGGEVGAIGIGIVAGQQDGAAGESGFDGVHRGNALAFFGAGATAGLAVGFRFEGGMLLGEFEEFEVVSHGRFFSCRNIASRRAKTNFPQLWKSS